MINSILFACNLCNFQLLCIFNCNKYGFDSIWGERYERMGSMGAQPVQSHALIASSFSKDAMAVANTRVDWKETPEAHVFTADLPGLRKEDLKINLVDKSMLRISGERHKEQEEKTDQWHRVERSSGRFMRQFRLPENVNVDGISAKLENGVLTVNAPKTRPDVANGGDVKSIDIGSA